MIKKFITKAKRSIKPLNSPSSKKLPSKGISIEDMISPNEFRTVSGGAGRGGSADKFGRSSKSQ